MTPETRAARDRLAAFAQPGYPMPDLKLPDSVGPLTVTEVRRIVQQITRGMQETLAPDILLMLAELDETQRPCSHTWNGHIDASESGATIHLGGYSGGGKLLAAHARARDLAADLTNALDEQQAQADARTDGWG